MQQKRYHDAQLIAHGYINVGGVIKAIGVVLAILIGLSALMAAGMTGNSGTMNAGLVVAVLTGILFFGVGMLFSAFGQMLLATVDTAENTQALGGLAENTQVLREIRGLLLEGKGPSRQAPVDKRPGTLPRALFRAAAAPAAPAAAGVLPVQQLPQSRVFLRASELEENAGVLEGQSLEDDAVPVRVSRRDEQPTFAFVLTFRCKSCDKLYAADRASNALVFRCVKCKKQLLVDLDPHPR